MGIKGFLAQIGTKKLLKNAHLMPENDKFVGASSAENWVNANIGRRIKTSHYSLI